MSSLDSHNIRQCSEFIFQQHSIYNIIFMYTYDKQFSILQTVILKR